MYAILSHGGHQYRVAPGDRLLVDRLSSDVGSMVELQPVLFLAESKKEGDPGTTDAKGARVAAVVVSHRRGPKLRVFKYKAKKRYRRTMGHRSDLTELRVEAILSAGQPMPKAAAADKPAKTEKAPAAEAKPATAKTKPATAKTEE